MAERVAEQRQHVARNAKDDNVLELTEAYHNNLLREMGADVQRLYQRRIDTFPVGTPAVRPWFECFPVHTPGSSSRGSVSRAGGRV